MNEALYLAALGAAISDARRTVKETATNAGPVVTHMLKNAGINVAAPWCAAAVQDWADSAAQACNVSNPLDDVKLEAYVQSYYDWAKQYNRLVTDPTKAKRGYLVLYNFGGERWDHIGILKTPPTEAGAGAPFIVCEGNTNDDGGREGDRVALKVRKIIPGRVCFVAWAG